MDFKQLEQYFISQTATIYDAEEAKSLFFILIAHFEGWTRSSILMYKDTAVDPLKIENYIHITAELKAGKPLQYILGETEFYGLKFKVNPAVLIPRPETEELVDWILATVKEETAIDNADQFITKSILDIGTGSGCIPVVLKSKLKDKIVSAIDVSAEALQVATENAQLNETEITFIQADILNYKSEAVYDLIVSNPPYIKEEERLAMHQNVLAHEPHLALFVTNEKPLVFYEAIADFAVLHLRPNGKLFFEINEYLGKETVEMLRVKGFCSIVLRQDMQGKDRMIYCRLPSMP